MKPRRGGFLLAKIHQLAERVFARIQRENGLSELNPAQGRIMIALWERDDIPIRELAARTALEKSTLTSMLDRLEATGFIQRIPSTHDRRQVFIRRTDKDRAWRQRVERISSEMTELFYNGFTAEEIDRFEEYLARILENLHAAERRLKGAGGESRAEEVKSVTTAPH